MTLQDYLAIATFALALAAVVFALGKQASDLIFIKGELTIKLPKYAAFLIKLNSRVTQLERRQFEDYTYESNDTELEI
jgi:hypothetical protein